MKRVLLLLVLLLPIVGASQMLMVNGGETVGDPLRINVSGGGQLRIQTPLTTYRFLGTPENVTFVPQVPGLHAVRLYSLGGELVQEREIFVQDSLDIQQPVSVKSESSTIPPGFLINGKNASVRVRVTRNGSLLRTASSLKNLAVNNVRVADVHIEPNSSPVNALKLYDAHLDTVHVEMNTPSKRIKELPGKAVHSVFSVDVSGSNYSYATFERVATGDTLLRCSSWNHTQELCTGSWEEVMELFPGEMYVMNVTNNTNAYAETGVATINSVLPIYEPGERADLVMAILDGKGFLVPNATVSVTVISPNNESRSFSTTNGTVHPIGKGLFQAGVDTTVLGTYVVEVDALGPGVNMSMASSFSVNDTYPYDVLRDAPLSIDPWNGPYTVRLTVHQHNASDGAVNLTERIPIDYEIVAANGAQWHSLNDSQYLQWNDVDVGTTLTYMVQPPLFSPDVDMLGEAIVHYSSGSQMEARPWYVAVDPTESLDPIVDALTELNGVDLSSAQVNAISTDDTSYVTITKNDEVTVELSNITNSTPLESVDSLSCSLTYTSEGFSPAATFRVDDAAGGNVLGSLSFSASVGTDNTVTINNLQDDADFDISDLDTMRIFIRNNDGAQPDTISIDDVWCTVSYTLADLSAPTVVLHDPGEGAYSATAAIEFNYTPTENRGFTECRLYIDDVLNQTNSSPIVNASENTISSSIGEGQHNWTIECEDTSANNGTNVTRNFTVDLTNPAAFNLVSPDNQTVSTDLTPFFSWNQTVETNFRNYTLQLDNDPAFGSIDYQRNMYFTVTNTSYQFQSIIGSNTLYYWRVIAYDEVNRSTTSDVFTYTTDTVAPSSFSVIAPANNTKTTNRTPFIDWTATTETNFANYTIEFDDSPAFTSPNHVFTVTNRTTTEYEVQVFEQLGQNTVFYWRIRAFDRAGQLYTSGARVYETDNAPPLVLLESPFNNSEENVTNTVTFSYNVTDQASTVSWCALYVNGSQQQNNSPITEGTTQTFDQFLSNGDYVWNVMCSDSVGNNNASLQNNLTVNVTVDTSPPVVNIQSPDNNSYETSSTTTVIYTPDDASGISFCSIYLDGSFNQTNSSMDAGNQTSFTIPGLQDGPHSWYILCNDTATPQNQGSSGVYNFTTDTTPPDAFSLLAPDNDSFIPVENVTFNWTASNDTNFANYTFLLDNESDFSSPLSILEITDVSQLHVNLTNITSDDYFWQVIAFDLAGLSYTTASRTFELHAHVPRIFNATIDPPSPISYHPGQSYTFNVSVEEPLIEFIYLRANFTGTFVNYTPSSNATTDNHSWNFSYLTSNLAAGSYRYQWLIMDASNRSNQTALAWYNVTRNQTTTTLTMDGVADNLTVNESDIVNLTASVDYPAGAQVSILENGSSLGSGSSPFSLLRNFSTPGTFLINATYAGNENYTQSSQSLIVNVLDIENPTVSLISPEDNATDIDGIVTYFYNVTDTGVVDACMLYIDGVLNGTETNPVEDTSLSFSRTYNNDRNLTWQVRCNDTSGNLGNSSIYNLSIEINQVTEDLLPVNCVEETAGGSCAVADINVSDANWDGHGSLNKNQFNYVNVTVENATVPAGATIVNATITWEKFQGTNSGTFYLYWKNGTNWQFICSQAFTSSSSASPDNVACALPDLANRSTFNGGMSFRAGWDAGNIGGNIQYGTGYVSLAVTYEEDVTAPTVVLDDPADAIQLSAGLTNFNFTPSDVNLENCTLYGDFNGSFEPWETLTVAGSLLNDQQNSFSSVNLSVGFYNWNVQCYDIAGNADFALQNYTINITPPDLTVSTSDIVFSNNAPLENENITINATIFNDGLTDSEAFIVRFYLDDPDIDGVQINGDVIISNITGLSNTTVNITYNVSPGRNNIFVVADVLDNISELSETNNKANNTLNVDSYTTVYGQATANITLETSGNRSIFLSKFDGNTSGNIFFTRTGSDISFIDLIELGVNTQGDNTSDDFSDADTLLNMTGFADSINERWTAGTNTPLNVTAINIFGGSLDSVPIVSSDSSGNFTTGILWDSSKDSGNTQYDTTDAEPLVFVTQVYQDRGSDYGVNDYVADVPALLRSYNNQTATTVTIYIEVV